VQLFKKLLIYRITLIFSFAFLKSPFSLSPTLLRAFLLLVLSISFWLFFSSSLFFLLLLCLFAGLKVWVFLMNRCLVFF